MKSVLPGTSLLATAHVYIMWSQVSRQDRAGGKYRDSSGRHTIHFMPKCWKFHDAPEITKIASRDIEVATKEILRFEALWLKHFKDTRGDVLKENRPVPNEVWSIFMNGSAATRFVPGNAGGPLM